MAHCPFLMRRTPLGYRFEKDTSGKLETHLRKKCLQPMQPFQTYAFRHINHYREPKNTSQYSSASCFTTTDIKNNMSLGTANYVQNIAY